MHAMRSNVEREVQIVDVDALLECAPNPCKWRCGSVTCNVVLVVEDKERCASNIACRVEPSSVSRAIECAE